MNIGSFNSVTLYLIAALEVIRWLTNKHVFKIEANSKESSYIVTGSNTARLNAKKWNTLSKIKSIFKLTILLATFTIIYSAVCILMGAPFQANHEETLVLSTLLTSLTILPIGLYLGPSGTLQYLFYDTFELSSRDEVALLEYLQYNAVATLIGAWSGSVVAPLDWDREWQKYPIPNMVGGLIGFGIANIQTLLMAAFDLTRKSVGKVKKNL